MNSRTFLLLFFLLLLPAGCEKNENVDTYKYLSDSFLPMNIGNYWKANDENYTEITDTIRIDSMLYYKFYSRIGGDGIAVEYLRIDNKNNLIAGSPNNPGFRSVRAKFNSSVGDTFYTLNNRSVNDYQVVVIFKNNDTIKFEWDMIYHPNLKGNKIIKAYKRGYGLIQNWKEVCIDKKIYTY